MTTHQNRWRCGNCDTISLDSELLTSTSPFEAAINLMACPKCKEVFGETITNICDEPGCFNAAGCGWPTGDLGDEYGGYRMTCAKHSDNVHKRVGGNAP